MFLLENSLSNIVCGLTLRRVAEARAGVPRRLREIIKQLLCKAELCTLLYQRPGTIVAADTYLAAQQSAGGAGRGK